MFKGILTEILETHDAVVERDKGVAFLLAARSIYELADISYFCINIPRHSSGSFVHCAFSGDFASQAITPKAIALERLQPFAAFKLADAIAADGKCASRETRPSANCNFSRDTATTVMRLTRQGSEFAILGFTRDPPEEDSEVDDGRTTAELKILGNYFHNHMLRRNGADTGHALVVSGRELDCLRWVAAGKSAWEASIILGISERTVRFHLNSAREKLNCTTTTQAVAKVVSQQLIAV